MEDKSKVLKTAETEKVKFVQMQFMDILGTVKNVTIPVSRLERALEEGVFFDGSSILGYATIEESDMRLMPDPKTFTILPWTEEGLKTARMVCDVYDHENNRFEGDPRYAIQRILGKARAVSYTHLTLPTKRIV